VARKSKIEIETQADSKGAEPAVGRTEAEPAKPKRKKASPKKKTVPAVKPVAPGKAVLTASVHEPSDEEIRLRAYFIAERRIQLSLQGDSAHDWIEAKRQLVEEANRTAS
jgi:hypothetical protein